MTSIFVRFYEAIIRAGEAFQSYLLLAMRLFWGYKFYEAGMQKLGTLPKVAQFFASLGIPFAEANSQIVAYLEAGGGVLLMIGLASRLVSIPLTAVLCTAYVTAHNDSLLSLFQDPSLFISASPFNFLIMCLCVFAFGPGKFSLDYLLERKK